MLGDDDAPAHAHGDRVHRLAQEHIGINVQHVLDALGLGRLAHPVHDRSRLVVGAGRVVPRCAEWVIRLARPERPRVPDPLVVLVHERGPYVQPAVRLELLLVAREEPRDAAWHSGEVVAVEDAERLVVVVLGALGAEHRVHARRGRRSQHRPERWRVAGLEMRRVASNDATNAWQRCSRRRVGADYKHRWSHHTSTQ